MAYMHTEIERTENGTEYTVRFETTNYDDYIHIENECRKLLDKHSEKMSKGEGK